MPRGLKRTEGEGLLKIVPDFDRGFVRAVKWCWLAVIGNDGRGRLR
jgi:hypothetical protein